MKRKLLIGIVALTVCISMFAVPKMCFKLDDGQIVKYDVDKVVEVYYETIINDTTPPQIDSFIVDASRTPLVFGILSDTTVEVSMGSCGSIDSVNIPSKVKIDGKVYEVTSIGEKAFYECSNWRCITIPESVTSIGKEAFYNCSELRNITISEGITSIGYAAFYECSSLESITIPEGVKSIEGFAFGRCTSLESITIPEGVTSIGYRAFQDCENLDVVIENSKENVEIGEYAFDGCKSVTYTK
jgi:hypothetical protein